MLKRNWNLRLNSLRIDAHSVGTETPVEYQVSLLQDFCVTDRSTFVDAVMITSQSQPFTDIGNLFWTVYRMTKRGRHQSCSWELSPASDVRWQSTVRGNWLYSWEEQSLIDSNLLYALCITGGLGCIATTFNAVLKMELALLLHGLALLPTSP